MWHRILTQLKQILGLRAPELSGRERLEAQARETQVIYDHVLRRYLRERFGSDEARIARILAEYEDWLMTAEMRFHIISVDGAGVLIPIRLLDSIAAALGFAPITVETPAWAVDDELDARHHRSRPVRLSPGNYEAWLSATSHEGEVLRALTVRHGLARQRDGAT